VDSIVTQLIAEMMQRTKCNGPTLVANIDDCIQDTLGDSPTGGSLKLNVEC
jgi:hypothetical protein